MNAFFLPWKSEYEGYMFFLISSDGIFSSQHPISILTAEWVDLPLFLFYIVLLQILNFLGISIHKFWTLLMWNINMKSKKMKQTLFFYNCLTFRNTWDEEPVNNFHFGDGNCLKFSPFFATFFRVKCKMSSYSYHVNGCIFYF